MIRTAHRPDAGQPGERYVLGFMSTLKGRVLEARDFETAAPFHSALGAKPSLRLASTLRYSLKCFPESRLRYFFSLL